MDIPVPITLYKLIKGSLRLTKREMQAFLTHNRIELRAKGTWASHVFVVSVSNGECSLGEPGDSVWCVPDRWEVRVCGCDGPQSRPPRTLAYPFFALDAAAYAAQRHTTVAYYKPMGVTCEDTPMGSRSKASQKFPKILRGLQETFHTESYLHCVGRLDQRTTGLLLLTTDPELKHHLLNATKLTKTYLGKVV